MLRTYMNIIDGFASNVPPFNFTEVCEAVIKLIDDPHAKIVLYPDLPTGADLIMTKKSAKEIFEKPEHDVKVKMMSKVNIDYLANIITFTSIPMQVTTNMIVNDINKLRLSGSLDEISTVNDRTTDQDGLILEIILKDKDNKGNPINPDVVLEKLYKLRTNLKKSNGCSITLIDNFVSHDYSLREFLLTWIDYRRDMVIASLNNKLANLLEKQHINDIKVFLCKSNNIEKTLSIAKKAKNIDDYRAALMKAYNITSLQAKVIAAMPTSAFNEDSRQAFIKDGEKMAEEIKRLEKTLESDTKVDKVIVKEMEEGIKKWGRERVSRVLDDENGLIENNSCIIGITEDGYIKKILDNKKPIGHVSKSPSSMMMALPASDTDTLLLFDSKGGKHLLPVSKIPLFKEKTIGLDIAKFIPVPKGARVVSSSVIPSLNKIPDGFVYTMITRKGVAKRVPIGSLIKQNLTSGSSSAIILNDNDELEVVIATEDDNRDIILFTDRGDGMRLPLSEIPLQLPGSKGTKVVSLKGTESILGANLMKPEDKYLVYVTSSGKLKKTEIKFFPPMKKKDEPICLINNDSGEYLVSVKSVTGNEKLTFYKKKSESETLKVSDIPIKTRAAKADKMLKILKGDVVLSMVVK